MFQKETGERLQWATGAEWSRLRWDGSKRYRTRCCGSRSARDSMWKSA